MAQRHGEEATQDGRKLTEVQRTKPRRPTGVQTDRLPVALCLSCVLAGVLLVLPWRVPAELGAVCRVRLFSRCSGGCRQPVRNRNQLLTDLLTRGSMGSSSAVRVHIFYIYVFHVYILFIFSLLLLRFVSYLILSYVKVGQTEPLSEQQKDTNP